MALTWLVGWKPVSTQLVGLVLFHNISMDATKQMPLTSEFPTLCEASCPSTRLLQVWKPGVNFAVRDDLQVLLPGNGTKEVMVDEDVRVTIQSNKPLTREQTPFVFVWINSESGDILAAEAGTPQMYKMSQVSGWKISFSLTDPGVYLLYFLAVTPPPHAQPPDPRTYRLEALRRSPLKLQVSQLNSDGTKVVSFDINRLPTRRCQLGVDELRGRWVRRTVVDQASQCHRLGCPRDGWTYVSSRCYWHVYSPQDTYKLAEMADSNSGRLSVVAAGSSVLRGCLQSLLDVLVPRAWEAFAGVPSIPGEGTTVKCWGWLEFQVDRLHLAFHDWRLPSYERSDWKAAASRIQKTISEGHDVIVIELGFHERSDQTAFEQELAAFWGPVFRAVLPSLQGKIILFTGLHSPFSSTICRANRCTISWGRAGWVRHSIHNLLLSWPAEEREASQGKVLVLDPAPMALPLFFDGETDLGTRNSGSQHWHRYDNSIRPGRKVLGAVADAVGQLFVSELLRDRKFGSSAPTAETQTTRVCAQCPVNSCCPWRPLPLELEHTLAKVENPRNLSTWANLSLAGCGQMDVKK